jgi:hypothetical protein
MVIASLAAARGRHADEFSVLRSRRSTSKTFAGRPPTSRRAAALTTTRAENCRMSAGTAPLAVPAPWCMTCAGRPFGRSSARACLCLSRCRSSATRPSRSIDGMPSWTKPCSGKQRHASMRRWLPLRPHHRRPQSLLSVEVVDSGAALTGGESGHSTPAGRGLMLSGVYGSRVRDRPRHGSSPLPSALSRVTSIVSRLPNVRESRGAHDRGRDGSIAVLSRITAARAPHEETG